MDLQPFFTLSVFAHVPSVSTAAHVRNISRVIPVPYSITPLEFIHWIKTFVSVMALIFQPCDNTVIYNVCNKCGLILSTTTSSSRLK